MQKPQYHSLQRFSGPMCSFQLVFALPQQRSYRQRHRPECISSRRITRPLKVTYYLEDVYSVDSLPTWNVSEVRRLVPKLWQRACGVSGIQPSRGPCHVDSAGLGGKIVFQAPQAMLPKHGKRLACRDTDMENRLEMESSTPMESRTPIA